MPQYPFKERAFIPSMDGIRISYMPAREITYDPGDTVRFRHPCGGAWMFGMVQRDAGGQHVSIAYLALFSGEPCRSYVTVPRAFVRPTWPDPAWWSDDRPDENTTLPPDTPHVVPAG